MEPRSVAGGHANYTQVDEQMERVRAAFGERAFARLRALKGSYDPDTVLHRNQNIPPSTDSGMATIAWSSSLRP